MRAVRENKKLWDVYKWTQCDRGFTVVGYIESFLKRAETKQFDEIFDDNIVAGSILLIGK
jgi:hypothetical protein